MRTKAELAKDFSKRSPSEQESVLIELIHFLTVAARGASIELEPLRTEKLLGFNEAIHVTAGMLLSMNRDQLAWTNADFFAGLFEAAGAVDEPEALWAIHSAIERREAAPSA